MNRSNSTKTNAAPNHVRQKVQSVSPAQIRSLPTCCKGCWEKKISVCTYRPVFLHYIVRELFCGVLERLNCVISSEHEVKRKKMVSWKYKSKGYSPVKHKAEQVSLSRWVYPFQIKKKKQDKIKLSYNLDNWCRQD